MNLHFLDISYEKNNMCPCVFSYEKNNMCQHNVFKVHSCCSIYQYYITFLNFLKIKVYLQCLSISTVRQSDPVIHIYTFFSHIISHHVLSQDTGYSSYGWRILPIGWIYTTFRLFIHQLSNTGLFPLFGYYE